LKGWKKGYVDMLHSMKYRDRRKNRHKISNRHKTSGADTCVTPCHTLRLVPAYAQSG
jgi:hypothetical protein